MSTVKRVTVLISSVLVLLAVAGLVSPVFGQAAKKYKEQIKQYSKQLDKLSEKDEWKVSEKDRQLTRQWLKDARKLIAQGDADTAGWLLEQVDDSMALIQALIRAKEIEAMADDQEKTYHEMKEERVPKLEAEIEELRSRKQKLRNELKSLD